MKASARLVKALIALVVSVVLCIGVCLAWFSSNGKTDADGMGSHIKSTNIKTFSVKAFSLTDRKESGGVVTYTVGDERKGNSVIMEEYGNIQGNETAILLRFYCAFIEETGKHYDIAAEFAQEVKAPVAEDTEGDCDLMCNLSEVLDFFGAVIGGTVKKGDKVVQGSSLKPAEDGGKVNLNGGEAYDGDLTYTFYCIIDYSDSAIEEKYLYALNNIEGCSLNSQMRFVKNMSFYVAET